MVKVIALDVGSELNGHFWHSVSRIFTKSLFRFIILFRDRTKGWITRLHQRLEYLKRTPFKLTDCGSFDFIGASFLLSVFLLQKQFIQSKCNLSNKMTGPHILGCVFICRKQFCTTI